MEDKIDNEYYARRRQTILNNIQKNNIDFEKIEDENKKIVNTESYKEELTKTFNKIDIQKMKNEIIGSVSKK
jgi:hypothetical protein